MKSPDNELTKARAAMLLDVAPVMFVWLDLEGRVRHVNACFERISGLRLDEVSGRDWFDTFVPASDRARVRELFLRAARRAPTSGTIVPILVRAGTEREVEWQSSIMIDDEGRPTGVVAVGIDVSDRVRTQRQLAEAERIAQLGSWSLDLVADRLVWSEEAFRIFEIDPAQFAASYETFLAAVHPDDRANVDATYRRSIETKAPYEIVHRLRMRDGRIKYVRERGRTHYDDSGRPLRTVGTLQDVTAEITAERRLREILDGIFAFVAVLDLEGRVVEVNRAPLDRAGIRREDVLGRSFAEVYWWADAPDMQARIRATLPRAAKGEVVRTELRARAAGDERIDVDTSFGPLRDENGNVERIITSGVEITERKRAEEALREADRRKNEFIAMLSHEIRNPLASIRASSYILERAAPGSPDAKRARDIIERQTKHVSRLVDDLLDVTRVTRGKITLLHRRVELDALLRTVAEDHRAMFERGKVELSIVPAGQPLYVDGDPTRLAQIVGNLLDNAAKFASAGGHATLSLELDAPDHVFIRVRDDGPGIEPETLAHIFEPFVQAKQALDRSGGGLGLGLALVKGLAELHGGTVSAESGGPGTGAQFSVRLPLMTPAHATSRPAPVPHGGAGRRVLVVEDNVDVADSLRDALTLFDHQVDVAYTGTEGLEKARALEPDIVLCDIGLPGLDGYQVARAIRADPQLRSTFLVALSGYCSPEDVERSKAAGFSRHLAKPADLDVIEKLVEEAR